MTFQPSRMGNMRRPTYYIIFGATWEWKGNRRGVWGRGESKGRSERDSPNRWVGVRVGG